ncbi:MAG: FG-GAP repeat domain-containing protein, partial [Acidimicrobiia bacterium]
MTRPAVVWAAALLIVGCTTAEDSTGPTVSEEPTTAQGAGSSSTGSATSPPGTGGLSCWSAPTSGEPGDIGFEDVTDSLGLIDPLIGLYGHVAAFGEVNGDGFPDLVVGTFADRETEAYQVRGAEGPSPDRLLLSKPGLTLDPEWSTELGRTSGAAFADFDLDGDSDLLLVRHAGRDADIPTPTRLFENVDGVLEAHSEPLPGDFRGRTPAVADYDADGLLDVYVAEDNSGETGGLLLHNEGFLEFSDVTDGSGLAGILTLSAAAGDLNDDRLPDLATSTAVFVNRGQMQFEDVTPAEYAAVPIGEEDDPAGVALGDLDRDGLADIVVGQHYRATVEFDSEVPVRVFLNGGGDAPVFEDVTEAAGMTPLPTLAPHVELADVDNDGWPDIVTTASAGDGTAPAVYRSLGGDQLRFEVSSGLGSDQYWIGGPTVDIDHDGRLDVFVVEWEPSLPSLMFRNVGDSGHWL